MSSALDPDVVATLASIRLSDADLSTVLHQVIELASTVIPGDLDVSVTLLRGDKPFTGAVTSAWVAELDDLQYALGSGPCLDAAAAGETVSIPDLTREVRWATYCPMAVDRGVLSMLAVGLPVQDAVLGCLNLYARSPGTFDQRATETAVALGGYAAIAIANAHAIESSATLARQMREAMESRAVIEQAKGIIMAERRCTPAAAFDILVSVSQSSNRKLRAVAEALVDRAAAGAPPQRNTRLMHGVHRDGVDVTRKVLHARTDLDDLDGSMR